MKNKQVSVSRTQKAARNAVVSLTCQCIGLLLQFLCRAVFVRTLGKEYLGVSGLFSNILTVLSFAELGIGGSITYQLYKPLAQGDHEKIRSLMSLYKRAYQVIGTLIGVCGLLLLPFLKWIIRTEPDIQESLYLIYLLYLSDTVSSYFLSCKKTIMIADQQVYLVNFYTQVFHIIQVCIQTAVLLIWGNFILYLWIQIVCSILVNAAISLRADKLYPELQKKGKPLPRSERREIFSDVRALAVYKIGSTVLNGTDNILVSAMFSVGDVGIVSNYLLISSAFSTILGKVTESFTASVGNLNACGSPEQKYRIFRDIFFLCAWLFGYVTIGMMLLADPVVSLVFGSEYIVPAAVRCALVISFYVSSMQYAAFSYRTTNGLFRQGRAAPACAALLNIILSVVLGKLIGLSGIYFATAISRFCTITVTDGCLVYRKVFGKNPLRYFACYFGFAGLFVAVFLVLERILPCVPLEGVRGIMVRILLVTVLYHGLMFFLFRKTAEFQDLLQKGRWLLFHRQQGTDIDCR